MTRDLDLVLFGASGYTGKITADYLTHAAAREPLRWALAGRSRDKLEAVRADLGDGAKSVEIIVADSSDAVALAAMAKRATVVCSTVGPYAKYGSEVVAACAAAGTHYCDLTGEVQWMRRMIDAHHARARDTGARIVHGCGFDSIPSDLGVYLAQKEFRARFGAPATSITGTFRVKGGFSGGTLASMFNIADELKRDPALRKMLGNPFSLDPDPTLRHGKQPRDFHGAHRDQRTGRYTTTFVMAACNTRIVRRSHALAGFPWGESFQYAEVMATSSPVTARLVNVALGGFALAMAAPVLGGFLKSQLPAPGEGPSEAARNSGFWHAELYATGPGGELVYEAGDHYDPGYGSTPRMLGEAALCLARDPLTSVGGVITPSIAMGDALAERLRAAGLTFAPAVA